MLNPPFEVGPAGWIYLRGKCRNFYFLYIISFANSGLIFAMRDPKLVERDVFRSGKGP